ncbi:hypothetical protein M3027_19900 [Geoalkalibacter halelectricus]|nr:hypothetical protein [Geoalkalibacter halelectricus]
MGYTLERMAEELHLPMRTYLKYERGERAIPDDMPQRFAISLKKVNDLVDIMREQLRESRWSDTEIRVFSKKLSESLRAEDQNKK